MGGVTKRKVIPLGFYVYVHHEAISTSPEEGVRSVHIPMIISRGERCWVLDCLDMAELEREFKKTSRSKRKVTLAPVLLKAAGVIAQQGINPRHVRGWGKWFNAYTIEQAWRWLGVD
jgi:hypothetical protein